MSEYGVPPQPGRKGRTGDRTPLFGDSSANATSRGEQIEGIGGSMTPVALRLDGLTAVQKAIVQIAQHKEETALLQAVLLGGTPATQPAARPSNIESAVNRLSRNGRIIDSVTPAGSGARPVLPTRPHTNARSAQPVAAIESGTGYSRNIFRRHRVLTTIGACAVAGAALFAGTINFAPPAKAWAQKTPGIERLVLTDSHAGSSETADPQQITADLIANLPNLTAIEKPIFNTPLSISEALSGESAPELSYNVSLTQTTADKKQITLNNLLRLVAENPYAVMNYQYDKEAIAKSLKLTGDGNYELSIDAIKPTVVFLSGLKEDGTRITDSDLASQEPPTLVTLGSRKQPADLLWKAVTTAGPLKNNEAVAQYLDETYGADSKAIKAALKANASSIAAHILSEAISKLLKDPLYFDMLIEHLQKSVNADIAQYAPGKTVTITFNVDQVKAFTDAAKAPFADKDTPLTQGMSYDGKLNGLKSPK